MSARRDVRGHRHLGDIELEPAHHAAERVDERVHLHEFELAGLRLHGAVLEGPIVSLRAGDGSQLELRHGLLYFQRRRFSAVLFPWQERRVDHAWRPLAADRPNGKVNVFQSKRVRRDLLQREAVRCELPEREFARLEAVSARALDGNGFHGDEANRKIREFRHFSLHYHRPAPALERFDTEQYWEGPGAGGTVEHDVHALAA